MPPGGEHIARLNTEGAGWQDHAYRDARLNICLRYCDRIAILMAGIAIGLLVAW